MPPDRDSSPTLTPTTFHILLALGEEPRHGYAVMQEVTVAGVPVGPGTVYGALHRMQQAGWVKASGVEKARGALGKRQRYALTVAGREVLRQEARRILDTADLVRAHRVFVDEG
jgi:DNA-binding PadR family transcriptional regulator